MAGFGGCVSSAPPRVVGSGLRMGAKAGVAETACCSGAFSDTPRAMPGRDHDTERGVENHVGLELELRSCLAQRVGNATACCVVEHHKAAAAMVVYQRSELHEQIKWCGCRAGEHGSGHVESFLGA